MRVVHEPVPTTDGDVAMTHRRTSCHLLPPTPGRHPAVPASDGPTDAVRTDGRRRLRSDRPHKRSALVVAVVIAVALSSCSLVGKSLPDLDESGRTISLARVDERRRAVAGLDAFEARAHSLHRVGPTGWHDECSPGQDNFELHDAEAYRCSLTTVRLYTFAGDFRSGARQVGEDLVEGPCTAGRVPDVERTLRRYYDQFIGTKPHNYPRGYTADSLPISSGSCVADTEEGSSSSPGTLAAHHWFTVPVPAPYELEDPEVLPLPCNGRDHCHDRLLNVRSALGAKADGDTWAVAVTSSKDYWVVGWDGRGSRPSHQ